MVKKIFAKSYLWLMLFLMYAPILLLCVFSFTDSKFLGEWNGFTLSLYEDLFKNNEIMVALFNTLMVALVSSICATILGTLGAIGIFYSKKKTKKALELGNQIPVMNAEIIMAVSLAILFTLILSFVNRVTGKETSFNFVTLIIGHMVITTPFVVLSVMPKLKQMDPNIYEAALDLGATPKYALLKVVLPEIMPGILSGFLLSITLSLDDYIITVFTKADTYTTLSTLVFEKTKKVVPPALRALTTIIFFVMLLFVLLINLKQSHTKVKEKRRYGR